MGIQLKFSTALLCTAVALQALCIPTATARPGHFQMPPQVYYNHHEQEQEIAENNGQPPPQVYYNHHEQEQEIAESNGIFKFWYGTGYTPITTPRKYDVFALQVSSPDRDDAYCLHTMRDNGRIRVLPACLKPKKAECKDYTVGSAHTVTVCEGLIKKYFIRDEYGPCYDPAKNSCPST